MKPLKLLVVGFLFVLGILRLARWLNRDRLIILTYHGVLPSMEGSRDYLSRNFVDRSMFRWQMRYLSRKYHCLALGEAVKILSSGEALPPYSAVVTFDDGFRNNFTCAFPILRQYGVRATIFLTTGHVGQGAKLLWTERAALLITCSPNRTMTLDTGDGVQKLSLRSVTERNAATRLALQSLKSMSADRRDRTLAGLERQLGSAESMRRLEPERYAFLEWDDIREMARAGIQFGSHTTHHAILTTLDDQQRFQEVAESKREVEERLGAPCVMFSYPNGTPADFDRVDKENLKRAGYVCAATQIPGFNDSHTDLMALRRVNIGRGHERLIFIAQLSGCWSWLTTILTPLRRVSWRPWASPFSGPARSFSTSRRG